MISSSSENVTKLNSINRRMFITGSLKFFIMIGLVSRLFFLQVKENKKYLTLFFSFDLILMNYLVNTFFTFLFYIIFVSIFKYYLKGLND